MALKNAFQVSLEVNRGAGFEHIGNTYWDKFSGGKASLGEVKYQPAEGVQRTYTGIKTIENITIESEYQELVHGSLIPGQSDATDIRGLPAKVTVQDLVPGSNPPTYAANRPAYEGVVLEVTPPDYDSNDAGSVAMIAVIVSVGSISTG